jgi:4-hydroxy-tetrahydrodipicolinate reductase
MEKMNKVIVVGNGKLADAILDNFSTFSDLHIERYDTEIDADSQTVFVHVGSGRQYEDSLSKAKSRGASYIQAATRKTIKMNPPAEQQIRYITASNLDINIIKLMYWLKMGESLFENEKISIVESHQKEKTSRPGTALKFCEYLNIDEESIKSIREPEQQRELNIQNIDHHAFHRIQIGDEDSRIIIETRIEGALPYVKGLARIIDCLPELESGNYEIDDLLKHDLLI